eukprot:5015895-Amphidinium_carterae.1
MSLALLFHRVVKYLRGGLLELQKQSTATQRATVPTRACSRLMRPWTAADYFLTGVRMAFRAKSESQLSKRKEC